MKFGVTLAFAAFGLAVTSSEASAASRVAVFATENATGAITSGDTISYTKSFDVAVTNLSQEAIDLDEICLTSRTVDGGPFDLDTVDEALIVGTLEAGESVRGLASFASQDAAIRDAVAVYAGTAC